MDTDRQEIALPGLGIQRIFIEKASGKNTERPQFKKMMEYIREGDILYIPTCSQYTRLAFHSAATSG